MDLISPKSLRLILKTLSTIQEIKTGEGNSVRPNQVPASKLPARPVNSHIKSDAQAQMRAQTLNRTEQSAFMKELLNLPQDMKGLIAQLAGKSAKNTASQTIMQLLQSMPVKISPEVIQQLLETNSKEVINKLIKLIQQSPGNTQGFEQLKPLLDLLSQLTPSRTSSPQEVLTYLLLLYLPWLPLMEEQKIQLNFEKKKSAEDEDEKVAMVIYITTVNLGRFKVTIYLDNKKTNPDILIEHISENPENKTDKENTGKKEIMGKILKTLKTELKEENITAKTAISETTQENFQKSEERNVTVTEINDVSPVVLLTAQKVARIILEIDEKICLVEKRKQDLHQE